MARPWETLARETTADGELELRRRGDDFLICLDGRVIMTSAAHRSEARLAAVAIERVGPVRSPRVLIGGLGMGFTLRAALDALPPRARVVVAELHPVVVAWCRGPLAPLTGAAVRDPRVEVAIGDVADAIALPPEGGYHAVCLDLFSGPGGGRAGDPHFGREALARTRAALAKDGVLAVWSEQVDPRFEKGLRASGFRVERHRPEKGGRRHAISLAIRADDTRDDRRRGSAARSRS